MLKLTNFRLQLLWGLVVGTIALASVLPYSGNQANFLAMYFNRHWVHFLAYLAVSILPLLTWRRKAGLALSLGTTALAIGSEMARTLIVGRPLDIQYIVINSLGIVAGILLGLNILTLRSRVQADS
jgi:hypothetical protein